MKNLSIFEPQIEKHHAYKKKTCISSGLVLGWDIIISKQCVKVKFMAVSHTTLLMHYYYIENSILVS